MMQKQPSNSRKYSPPNLTTYGDVIKYTASGTAGDTENKGKDMSGPTFNKP